MDIASMVDLIDMAWGWVEYDSPLTSMEIYEYELISRPVEE